MQTNQCDYTSPLDGQSDWRAVITAPVPRAWMLWPDHERAARLTHIWTIPIRLSGVL